MMTHVWLVSTLMLALLMCFSSCKTGQIKGVKGNYLKPNPTPPADYTPAVAKQITKSGQNHLPVFSPDKNKILFISKLREQHQNAQIYEFDTKSNKEKRITFQNGNNISVNFFPNGRKIIYSSTTDELKETPNFIQSVLKKSPDVTDWEPTEIYSSQTDGSGIRRLTSKPQLDAFASFHPKQGYVLFSSLRDGTIELYTMKTNGRHVRQVTKSAGHKLHPSYSPNGKKIVWMQKSFDLETSQIWIGTRSGRPLKALTEKEYIAKNPIWTANGESVVFSANKDDKDNFELYMADVKSKCIRRLTYNSGQDIEPRFDKSGKKVVFSSDRTGSNQVYVMDFLPPKPCISENTSIK